MNSQTLSRTYSFLNYVFQEILLVTLNSQSFELFYDTFFPCQTVLVAFPKRRKKGLENYPSKCENVTIDYLVSL